MLLAYAILHVFTPVIISLLVTCALLVMHSHMPFISKEPDIEPRWLLNLLIFSYCFWLVYPLLPNDVGESIGSVIIVTSVLWCVARRELASLISVCMNWHFITYCCGKTTAASAAQILFHYSLTSLLCYVSFHAQKNDGSDNEALAKRLIELRAQREKKT